MGIFDILSSALSELINTLPIPNNEEEEEKANSDWKGPGNYYTGDPKDSNSWG